jgi:hypothetical protein
MKAVDILNKVKVILGLEQEPVELSEAKLSDGSIIQYENLEVGSVVTIISEDGTTQPLVTGEYELEDKSKLTIGEDGSIINYVKVDEEIPEEEEEAKKEVEAEEVTEAEVRITALEEAVNMLMDAVNSLLTENETKMSALETKLSEVDTKVIELSAQPAGQSLTEKVIEQEMTAFEKFRAARK